MRAHVWNNISASSRSVLLLEDNDELAATLIEFLELYGCKTVRVANGVEGLRKIMQMDFDVVLCDMVMPAFPGDMFYLAVERVKPSLCRRFVFMSGHKADPKWDIFIQEIGGLIVWKPFQMHELVGAMQTVMGTALQLRPDQALALGAACELAGY